MLPNLRFLIGATLATSLLGVVAVGLATTVRLSHQARVTPLEASRSLAYTAYGDHKRAVDPELARLFDALANADVSSDEPDTNPPVQESAPPPTQTVISDRFVDADARMETLATEANGDHRSAPQAAANERSDVASARPAHGIIYPEPVGLPAEAEAVNTKAASAESVAALGDTEARPADEEPVPSITPSNSAAPDSLAPGSPSPDASPAMPATQTVVTQFSDSLAAKPDTAVLDQPSASLPASETATATTITASAKSDVEVPPPAAAPSATTDRPQEGDLDQAAILPTVTTIAAIAPDHAIKPAASLTKRVRQRATKTQRPTRVRKVKASKSKHAKPKVARAKLRKIAPRERTSVRQPAWTGYSIAHPPQQQSASSWNWGFRQ
jgi:hypothetical protein